MEINELVNKIKKKKVLKGLPSFFVKREIGEYVRKNPKASEKQVFKAVRRKLHTTYGSFQSKRKRKRNLYLEELKLILEDSDGGFVDNPETRELRERILRTSVSSRERLDADYGILYRHIEKLVGGFKSVVDLGCGMNPVSFSPERLKRVRLEAYDIDENDIAFLNRYFKLVKVAGRAKAKILDLHDLNRVKKLQHFDICFLFKIIDPLEERGHKFSEELLKSIKANFIVVSFATKTLAKKEMNHPQRVWFERMIGRIGLDMFSKIKTKNEVYYVLKKE